MDGETKTKTKRSQAIGDVFLMAASTMEPGFPTQTAKFTNDFHGSFDFAIIASLLLSFIMQTSARQVLCVTNMRAQDVTNKLLPGLGYFLAIFVFMGDLTFSIGNIDGATLGLNAMMGLNLRAEYVTVSVIAVIVFSVKNAQGAVDNIARILSILKILIILGVMIVVQPPMGMALKETSASGTGIPALFPSILTLVGGTMGGYIAFTGTHRLIGDGIMGKENGKRIVKNACDDLGTAVFSRFFLFMLVFGVVVKGVSLDPTNPTADALLRGGGETYHRVFGLLLFFAGIASTIGTSYTSLSFVKSLSKTVSNHNEAVMIAPITCTTPVIPLLDKPATLLVIAGALNTLVLPLALVISLVAAYRKDIVGKGYHRPIWLTVIDIVSTILFAYFAIVGMGSLF